MKKPNNLFYNGQPLPLHGWGLDPTDDDEWLEVWLVAYDAIRPYPFLGVVVNWGQSFMFKEFTVDDPLTILQK